MKKYNYILFIFVFNAGFLLSSLTGFKFDRRSNGNNTKRNSDDIKSVAYKLANEYQKSFTNLKNTKISLALHQEPKKAKFIFIEHKYDPTSPKFSKKDLIFFRVCVPLDSKEQAFMDIFCPFSPCDFKSSSLKCLKSVSDDVSKAITEINKFS